MKDGVELVVYNDAVIASCPNCERIIEGPKTTNGNAIVLCEEPNEFVYTTGRLIPEMIERDRRPKCPHCRIRLNLTILVK